jgi:hypothetical protein
MAPCLLPRDTRPVRTRLLRRLLPAFSLVSSVFVMAVG